MIVNNQVFITSTPIDRPQMNNSHLSTPDISRLRRHSKPSPPERDELKKTKHYDFSNSP